jgi:hypothetical protein
MMAKVDLASLNPNPTRDFEVDPIDLEAVAALTKSIKAFGFWGGVVCRQRRDGGREIGAGHTRVKAALQNGITTADLTVHKEADCSDEDMARMYATENATQRGQQSTARAGSVASAIRVIAREVLSGRVSGQFSRYSDLPKIRGNLTSEHGLGKDVVGRFLAGIPGINEYTIKQDLAALKSSGNYARIIGEVQKQLECEQKAAEEAAAQASAKERADAEAEAVAARQAAEQAQKATNAAKQEEITFDFKGVARHFKNPHQLEVFRKCVTGKGIAPYLPVKNQAALAKHLVQMAEDQGRELTGAFIKESVANAILEARETARRLQEEEKARLAQQARDDKARRYQEDFARGCRTLIAAAIKIIEQLSDWPKGQPYPISQEFRNNFKSALRALNNLNERI